MKKLTGIFSRAVCYGVVGAVVGTLVGGVSGAVVGFIGGNSKECVAFGMFFGAAVFGVTAAATGVQSYEE